MAQRSPKTNWVIHADSITKMEENLFLSNFGVLQKVGLHSPNVEHQIHHTVVFISYYEHSEGEDGPISIRKRMAVFFYFSFFSLCSNCFLTFS
jgi:hypothetical protein